ncbi:MAG: hypothetical protein K2L30_08965 [Duncaniella sp.]|nr:hypothetical protein [Duncaniella sp.]
MKRNLLLISMMTGALMMGATQWDNGRWSLVHEDNRLDISYDGKQIFPDVFSTVTYNLAGDDTEYTMKSNADMTAEVTAETVSDEFGNGMSYVFSYTDGHGVMKQRINIYDEHPYLIVGATIEAKDGGRVESRKMIPFATGKSAYPLPGTAQRILWVPFDNESHTLRYKSSKFGSTVKSPEGWALDTSSEVSAIYDPASREGIVVGSVDHDKWKSGITIGHKTGGRVPKLECLSGWTDYNLTKDAIPHGKVKGETVASARYMVGYFDDWREGMNTFGDANNLVAPRFKWEKGNPVGWNSWGNMMDHINYDGVYETAKFMHENLRDHGFFGRDSVITVSLDSFNGNVGELNLWKLGTKIFSNGTYQDGRETKQGWNMALGMYGGMVVWSWTLDSKIDGTGLNGTRDYYWKDVALKVNGKYYGYNGADSYAIDPTHPAMRANLEKAFSDWARNGTKYVKMDFMNAAIHEGDSWYDPEVTTGVMAYNRGMEIVRELAEKYDMYIVLAMSPLFPYQYAHGRRTCCDRWGRLGESEFVMNAVSYGWWTDRLYTVNDPDQMTMCQNDHNASETLGENRARATTGMATGAFIFGDTFSDHCYYTNSNGNHDRGDVVGYPAESRRRAIEIMGNEDINRYVRENIGSFMPVEGDNPSSSQEAETLYMRDTEQYFYLAVFNWSHSVERKGTVEYSRLGIDPANVGTVKELWTGDEVIPGDKGLDYSVPAADVRVYRISKLDYVPGESAIENVEAEDSRLSVEIAGGVCRIASSEAVRAVTVYDMAGSAVAAVSGENVTELPADLSHGVYLVSCRMASTGAVRTVKAVAAK